ncbi:MAG TPA: hypothetical protein VG711_05605, partial [Phycisphaerales bacterium]|nr:hypothetical protein [Phycisphaerales bacterium]
MLTLSITSSRLFQFLLVALLSLGLAASNTLGQTSPDAMKAEIQKLRDEIKAKDARIKQLESEVASLRAQLGNASQTAPDTSSQMVTIDESVPSASPRALLNALKTSYAEATKDLNMGAGDDDKA